MINENDLIASLKKQSQGFIGDDAAVLPNNKEHYVITKDLLIEGTHFQSESMSPADLAHKALHVNLSDLAAMGAKAQFIVCGIGIPSPLQNYATDFLFKLQQSCQQEQVLLIGGDTCKASDTLMISITAIGSSPKNQITYRTSSQASDVICHIGHLGHAHLGRMALKKNITLPEYYRQAFVRPLAKTQEGIWLGKQTEVTAMMDVSDGLHIDLKKLCDASKLGANIHLEQIIQPDSFLSSCQILSLDPMITALSGGEDYGLLFTVSKKTFNKISREFLKTFHYSIQAIGMMTKGSGIHLMKNQQRIELPLTPYTHFGETP